MTRVEPLPTKEPVVVSKQDYEADLKRGYTVLEFSPKGEMVHKNPRNPAKEIRREVPAVHMFRCMLCVFDVLDQNYTDGRTGLDIMKEHIFRREHPWPYKAFDSPYGNVEDVIIEGVEIYSEEHH